MQSSAQVVLADMDVEKAQESADELNALLPNQAVATRCDVRVKGQVEAAVMTAVSHFGGLDIAVANAGERMLLFCGC